MKNSHLASDGRVYAEIILTLRRDAAGRNSDGTASSLERAEFLCHCPQTAGHTGKNANAGPIPSIGSISAQPEFRSTRPVGQARRHGALLYSGLRSFAIGSGRLLEGRFGHPVDGPVAAR